MKTMKLGSLFDGSGGFPLTACLCGITPVWASEVEPYPIAVTRNRFPEMKHLGNVSTVNGADIEPVDIITFGSPCHDIIYDYDLSYNVHDAVQFDSEVKAKYCYNELKKNKDNEHRRNFMAFLYGNYSNYQIVQVETTIHKVIDLEV